MKLETYKIIVSKPKAHPLVLQLQPLEVRAHLLDFVQGGTLRLQDFKISRGRFQIFRRRRRRRRPRRRFFVQRDHALLAHLHHCTPHHGLGFRV